MLQIHLPCSGPFSASRVWWWGRISSFTLSAALAKNCVASASVQYSMLVPSMDRIWSPTCNAPHLHKKGKTRYDQVCSLVGTWVLLPSNWSWKLWAFYFFFSRERFVFWRHCHWSDFMSISTNLKNNSVNTVYAKTSLTELEWGSWL